MNTHEKNGEKLFSTVLQKFPLVSKWYDIVSYHQSLKSQDCHILCTGGLIVSGGCGLILYMMAGDFALLSSPEDVIFGIFFGMCIAVIGALSLYAACKSLWYNFSPSKQKKYLRSNKPAVRDYIAQKKAIRLVATLVPEFSTADLELLQSHPQFNAIVFKSVFEKELKKRAEAQIVNNVNLRFTENYVTTNIEEPQDVFCTVKHNMLTPTK